MMNNTENYEFDQNSSEANVPLDEAQGDLQQMKGSLPINKLKEYGKQAYAPLVQVVHKYQDEISPFISAMTRGLQGGVEALNGENASEADKLVAGWFREAADGLTEAQNKISSSDINEMVNFIEGQARKRPSFMFTSSYLTGLFFGRIGKHIGRKALSKKADQGLH